jgi:hypothetical protein
MIPRASRGGGGGGGREEEKWSTGALQTSCRHVIKSVVRKISELLRSCWTPSVASWRIS